MEVFELDARELFHPEPLERSLEFFKKLNQNRCFHLIIHRYPKPLLLIAKERGLFFEVCCNNNKSEWHILFSVREDIDLKNLMKRYCSV